MHRDGAGPVRVLVVDDDRHRAEQLTLRLRADERLTVVGSAQGANDALALADAHRPDVVLVDLEMAADGAPATTRMIRDNHPDTVVLMLTDSSERGEVAAAAERGAAGFLTTDSLSPDLACAILEIAALAGVARR